MQRYLNFAMSRVYFLFFAFLNLFYAVKCGCSEDVGHQAALYKMELVTEWTESRFPKHYPKWRPHAQFSTVVGRSHNNKYRLWRLGGTASDGMKLFLETGKTDRIVQEAQGGSSGILDEFYGPEIPKGAGLSESEFMVDTNHTRVSLMSRIVPSPDWFVGLDSLDLCPSHNGEFGWVKTTQVDLEPIDGGTDNGFTFTSPNWDTVPRTKMSRITSHFPSHPANSFFYPSKKNLPKLAHVRLTLLETFDVHHLNSITGRRVTDANRKQSDNDLRFHPRGRHGHHEAIKPNIVETEELDFVKKEDNLDLKKLLALTQQDTSSSLLSPSITSQSSHKPKSTTFLQSVNNDVVTEDSNVSEGLEPSGIISEKPSSSRDAKKKYKRKLKKKPKLPRPCRVSQWSAWSPCSTSCSFGESFRTKRIIKHAQSGGQQCPPLRETRWCGGTTRNCRTAKDYFVW